MVVRQATTSENSAPSKDYYEVSSMVGRCTSTFSLLPVEGLLQCGLAYGHASAIHRPIDSVYPTWTDDDVPQGTTDV